MQLKLAQLPAHLNKTLATLYALHGDELLLQNEAADTIRTAARKQGFLEREIFVVESGFNWQQLLAAGQNLSLFGDKRCIDIRIPSGKPGVEGAKALLNYIEASHSDDITLISLPKLERSIMQSAWFTALEEKAVLIATPSLEREELPDWIAMRLKHQQQHADAETLQFLAERTEGNLLAAAQEIAKLGLLLPTGEITLDDIEQAVLHVARYDIAQLSLAYLHCDAKRFCKVLAGLEAEGESVQLILWQINEDLHSLGQLAEERARGIPLTQAMRTIRVWGKRQQAMELAAQRVKLEQLTDWLKRAAELDALSKGLGKGQIWDELRALGLSVAGNALFICVK